MTTPHFVFWSLGIILVLLSVILRLVGASIAFWQFWADLSLNVGVSVLAVSIVDFLWRRLGGDPIMAAIHRLHTVTALLRDLEESGIERIYVSRDQFQGKKELLDHMRAGRQVDLVGITLQHGWANDPELRDILAKRAGHGKCHFRIMVFHPDSGVVKQRDKEEAEEFNPKSARVSSDAGTSLNIFSQIRSGLPKEDQPFLEIRAIFETNLYCSIIRVDNMMLVSQYLISRRGSKSPTLEVRGAHSPFYQMYAKEFNQTWTRAIEWPPPIGSATY